MRTAEDAVYSVKRYLATALGADWEVRLWDDEGAFSPPVARVSESGPMQSARHGRASVDCTLPVQVHCYTAPAISPSGSLARTRAVEELLFYAIEVGVGDARPRRIPLYDTTTDTRAYYDFVRVSDFSAARVQDSADPTLIVVVADLRLTWSRSTLIDVPAMTVSEVHTRIEAS